MAETTPDAARIAAQESFARARKSGTRTMAECLSAALDAAGRLIRQDEREHLAQLAAEVGATYRSTYSFTEGCSKVLQFADLIREAGDD